ncbi:hypothetical protein COO60DRAFT_1457526 [Scenedesmus sp. NREL 46B-D3]|nr:hypothetical protein COO60DRAFT_1457526 [Scenedesmus sp. NREL 46B-D3]
MASSVQRLALCMLLVFAVASVAQARKLVQAVGKKEYSGDTTVAEAQTAANIQNTVNSGAKPGTATSVVKATPLKPLAAATMSTLTDSRHTKKKTDKGGVSQGGDTASQAAKAATISSYASGTKPASKRAIQLSSVPGMAAQIPVGTTAQGTGVGTSLQTATSVGINNQIDAQLEVVAKNAMPGPNKPLPKP